MPSSKGSDSGEEQSRFSAFKSSMGDRWTAFHTFLWDPTDKTVLGRGGKSWGRILIFYMFYYSFLAALFAASISIVLSTLNPYVPTFQTRVQTPGMSIQPRLKSSDALNSDIKYKHTDPESYKKYTKRITEILWDYSIVNQTNPVGAFRNCPDGKVQTSQTFSKNETKTACIFNKDLFGPCASGDYGYSEGKPCIFVKVNKIIGWFPVGFSDITNAVGGSDSKAPPLVDVLKARNASYTPFYIYVSCYGRKPEDYIKLNGVPTQVSDQTKYYPSPGGLPFKYFPYYGNLRDPWYRTPYVAVQFNNISRGEEVAVSCKAYAKNILDDMRLNVGYYSFFVKID